MIGWTNQCMKVMKFDFSARILQVANTLAMNDFPNSLQSTLITASNTRTAYGTVFGARDQLSGKQTRAGCL